MTGMNRGKKSSRLEAKPTQQYNNNQKGGHNPRRDDELVYAEGPMTNSVTGAEINNNTFPTYTDARHDLPNSMTASMEQEIVDKLWFPESNEINDEPW
jgi:hypothetical protein